jgi:hypothetical protein
VAAAVVGENTMDEVTFKFPKEKAAKGGIVGEEFDNKVAPTDQAHLRYTVRLVEIFQRFNVPKDIDYLSLDVEGAEDFVMGTFPFSEYQFKVLTVERPSSILADILGSHGYILFKTLKKGKETLWAYMSVETSLDKSAMEIDGTKLQIPRRGGTAKNSCLGFSSRRRGIESIFFLTNSDDLKLPLSSRRLGCAKVSRIDVHSYQLNRLGRPWNARLQGEVTAI